MYKIFAHIILCGSLLPVVRAQDTIQHLSPEAFRQYLEGQDENIVLLDVRTDEEVQQGIIPGAIQVDVRSPDFKARAGRLDRTKTYLLYCKSGVRSEKAAAAMKAMGFKKLFSLEGGITAWKKKGFAVEKKKP